MKKNIRIIARLDIKSPNLIKPINLEGVRVVGDPQAFSERYYLDGIDEIFYMDAVATLYGRNSLAKQVEISANKIFIPMTVGGGIRSVQDVDKMLRAGADKIAINTAVVYQPSLIADIAKRFGSQCMVLSIEAKAVSQSRWEVYTDNGRNKTGRDVIEWVKEAESLGVGEILLTSVDREGTCEGFDVELNKQVTQAVNVPIIASGGMGCSDHMHEVIVEGGVDAIAIAHVLHYEKVNISDLKSSLINAGYSVRLM